MKETPLHSSNRCRAYQITSIFATQPVAQHFEQFAKKSLCRLFIASALHEDVEHIAMLVHCTPQAVLFAFNGEDDLVQMPFIPTTRTPMP
jgi:hypothetical protein